VRKKTACPLLQLDQRRKRDQVAPPGPKKKKRERPFSLNSKRGKEWSTGHCGGGQRMAGPRKRHKRFGVPNERSRSGRGNLCVNHHPVHFVRGKRTACLCRRGGELQRKKKRAWLRSVLGRKENFGLSAKATMKGGGTSPRPKRVDGNRYQW